jgi:hypothetical protein
VLCGEVVEVERKANKGLGESKGKSKGKSKRESYSNTHPITTTNTISNQFTLHSSISDSNNNTTHSDIRGGRAAVVAVQVHGTVPAEHHPGLRCVGDGVVWWCVVVVSKKRDVESKTNQSNKTTPLHPSTYRLGSIHILQVVSQPDVLRRAYGEVVLRAHADLTK